MKAVFFLTFIASALVAGSHAYDPTDFGFGETLRG